MAAVELSELLKASYFELNKVVICLHGPCNKLLHGMYQQKQIQFKKKKKLKLKRFCNAMLESLTAAANELPLSNECPSHDLQ